MPELLLETMLSELKCSKDYIRSHSSIEIMVIIMKSLKITINNLFLSQLNYISLHLQ